LTAGEEIFILHQKHYVMICSNNFPERTPLQTAIFIILAMLLGACQDEDKSAHSSTQASGSNKYEGMVQIPSGTLHMGGDNQQAEPDEFPKHVVEINGFWMDETEVTNRQFSAFVEATGYLTIAERPINWEEIAQTLPEGTPKPPDSLLQPGALVFKSTSHPVSLNDVSQWWHWTIGANWRHPEGPSSSFKDKMAHPVVQLAWDDAMAYCKWAEKRLPTEAEWEWAARGGMEDMIYPWGNEEVNKGQAKANFWQGLFPYENSAQDGFLGTAPVKSFPPNGYGLYDMAGNVWEWCSDWYHHDFYKNPDAQSANTPGPRASFDPNQPYNAQRSMRGGSFCVMMTIVLAIAMPAG
jgi:sulfatase modifying factor 1